MGVDTGDSVRLNAIKPIGCQRKSAWVVPLFVRNPCIAHAWIPWGIAIRKVGLLDRRPEIRWLAIIRRKSRTKPLWHRSG